MNEQDIRSIDYLYHGSDVSVRLPDPFYSTIRKDFGQGFYVSVERRSAELWAKRVFNRNRMSDRRATVSTYHPELHDKLNVYVFDADSEAELDAWIDYVVYNRGLFTFLNNPLASNYDVVAGLIANGEWADLFEPFERRVHLRKDYEKEKRRLLEDLLEIEAARKLGYQCCFKTPIAVAALTYVPKESYYV